MSTIDELLDRHKKEIEQESRKLREEEHVEIPRDPFRRPWHGPATESITESIIDTTKKELPWFASFGGIGRVLYARKKIFISALIIFGCSFLFVAERIPVTYNSTLHLYAPEKWDTISSRLPLLTNRVEFASFPLEFKVPLSLLSRRLRSEEARSWVIAKYAQNPAHNVAFNPDTVKVETAYVSTSELLMVQGFANDPEIASDITRLYWEYLEQEIKGLRGEQLKKIENWITYNLSNYDS